LIDTWKAATARNRLIAATESLTEKKIIIDIYNYQKSKKQCERIDGEDAEAIKDLTAQADTLAPQKNLNSKNEKQYAFIQSSLVKTYIKGYENSKATFGEGLKVLAELEEQMKTYREEKDIMPSTTEDPLYIKMHESLLAWQEINQKATKSAEDYLEKACETAIQINPAADNTSFENSRFLIFNTLYQHNLEQAQEQTAATKNQTFIEVLPLLQVQKPGQEPALLVFTGTDENSKQPYQQRFDEMLIEASGMQPNENKEIIPPLNVKQRHSALTQALLLNIKTTLEKNAETTVDPKKLSDFFQAESDYPENLKRYALNAETIDTITPELLEKKSADSSNILTSLQAVLDRELKNPKLSEPIQQQLQTWLELSKTIESVIPRESVAPKL